MSNYAIVYCYGTSDMYYVEPYNEQECLFLGTYKECERFIEQLNQNKDENKTNNNSMVNFST